MYIIACEYCDTQISSYLFIQLSRMNWRTDSTHQNKFVTLQLGLLITTINKNESRPHAKIINFNHPTNTFVFVFFFYFDFVHFFLSHYFLFILYVNYYFTFRFQGACISFGNSIIMAFYCSKLSMKHVKHLSL